MDWSVVILSIVYLSYIIDEPFNSGISSNPAFINVNIDVIEYVEMIGDNFVEGINNGIVILGIGKVDDDV